MYYQTAAVTLHQGDCLDILPQLPAASVHAVVTDPPYGLQFMGQGWDAPWRSDHDIGRAWDDGMSTPGLRDSSHRLPWPSSAAGANLRCRRCHHWRVSSRPCRCPQPDFPALGIASQCAYQDWCQRWAAECLRILKPGGHLVAFGGPRTYHRLACAIEDAGFEVRDSIHWIYGQGFPKSLNVAKTIDKAARGVQHGNPDKASPHHGKYETQATEAKRGDSDAGQGYGTGPRQFTAKPGTAGSDRPLTPAAQHWQGWGTGLKPAHEPIVLARKPLAGTVASNVTTHHTGALHIDACRSSGMSHPAGRWPANLLFSHSPGCAARGQPCVSGCPVAELGTQAGIRRSGANPARRHAEVFATVYGRFAGQPTCVPIRGAEAGSAARFFPVFRYQPKASATERPRLPGIAHPTVKPLELMRWLVRLVAPPGALVLDPFAGTGTTLRACQLESMRSIGIEQDPGYAELCKTRLEDCSPAFRPRRDRS